MTEGLVLIDIQNDYFPGGRMEVVNAEAATQKARALLDTFRKRNSPIVHIQHISTRKDATFLLPETTGIDINENVLPLENEKVIIKHFPNSFRDTELESYLKEKEVDKIVFCGMMSHMCVDTTVRAAFDKGYNCVVAGDACATRNLSYNGTDVTSLDVHAAYMAALGAVFAKVMPTDNIINQ